MKDRPFRGKDRAMTSQQEHAKSRKADPLFEFSAACLSVSLRLTGGEVQGSRQQDSKRFWFSTI